jgi:Ca-activated chloride channel family protein
VWRFAPPHLEVTPALQVPFFARLAELEHAQPGRGAVVRRRAWFSALLLGLVWICTVLALANPTLRSNPITITKSARDMLLAVDLSGSMDTQDLKNASGAPATRLSVVKEVVGDFVNHRKGDRLGLLVFGAAPYMQVPFTLDTSLVTRLLDESETHMAGDNTTLGDAIGLAIRTFVRSTASNRVLILLTDGNDTGSVVPPLVAAGIAAQNGITVHVIGVGDPTLAGEERLNEEVLAGIARRTSGRYFHANNRDELSKIYAELDRLEVIQFESHSYTPHRTVYYYPLGVGALLLSLFLVLFSLSRLSGMRKGK